MRDTSQDYKAVQKKLKQYGYDSIKEEQLYQNKELLQRLAQSLQKKFVVKKKAKVAPVPKEESNINLYNEEEKKHQNTFKMFIKNPEQLNFCKNPALLNTVPKNLEKQASTQAMNDTTDDLLDIKTFLNKQQLAVNTE